MQEVGTRLRSKRRASQANARTSATYPAADPATSRTPPRRSKTPRIVARKLASALAAFLAAFILTSIFSSESGRMRALTATVPEIDSAISFVGFGLDQVTVKGQRYTLVSDIFDALALEQATTFASFDAAAARLRIEALSWVASAELRRVYPNQLMVMIVERKPFALWQKDDGSSALVDKGGRVLSQIAPLDAPPGLARIKGPGAPSAAFELWEELSRYPATASRVLAATRIGKRRWTLTLANDSRIELPSGAVSAALKQLHDWPGFAGVKERGSAVVDLRTPGRIAVRSIEPVGPTTAGPRTISELLEPAG